MKKPKTQNEPFSYDRTLRDLLKGIPKKFITMLTGKEVIKLVDTTFPKTEERRADFVVELDGGEIFHLEVQTKEDKDMPLRMLKYAILIKELHNQFPKQMVLYLSEKEIVDEPIATDTLKYNYATKYIKDIDCHILMQSDDINDNILAVLCKIEDFDRFIKKLKERLFALKEHKRKDYMQKLAFLLRLRPNLYAKIEQMDRGDRFMPLILEEKRDPLYQKGMTIGIEKGIERGIERGIEKGIKKGQRSGKLESAYIMVTKYNMPIDKMAQDFKLEESELIEYINQKN
jgi:predicted transposase/invertase (TIGR01784 family)